MKQEILLTIAFLVGMGSLLITLAMGAYLYKIHKNMKKDKIALVKVYRQVFDESKTVKDLGHNIPKLKTKANQDKRQKALIKTLNSYSDKVTKE